MATTYYWRKGFQHRGVDPEVAGEELERIKEQAGAIEPADVVSAAKAKSSPLHKLFEWNNDLAAEQHRLQQARSLIASVAIKVTGPKSEPVMVRAFVSVPDDEGGHVYVGIKEAMRNKDRSEYVLSQARNELEGWRDRWKVYKELAELVEPVSKALESTAPKQRKAA